jgi:hypothetical protein
MIGWLITHHPTNAVRTLGRNVELENFTSAIWMWSSRRPAQTIAAEHAQHVKEA